MSKKKRMFQLEITIPTMHSRKHYAIRRILSKQIGDTTLGIICLALTIISVVILILNAISNNFSAEFSFKAVTIILPVAAVTLFYTLLKLTLSYADLEDENYIFESYANSLVICIEEQSDFKVKKMNISDDSVYRWNVELSNGELAIGIIDNEQNKLRLKLADDMRAL